MLNTPSVEHCVGHRILNPARVENAIALTDYIAFPWKSYPRACGRQAAQGNLCACRDYAVGDTARRIYGYMRRDDVSVRCARTGSRGYSMQQGCITPRESHMPEYVAVLLPAHCGIGFTLLYFVSQEARFYPSCSSLLFPFSSLLYVQHGILQLSHSAAVVDS